MLWHTLSSRSASMSACCGVLLSSIASPFPSPFAVQRCSMIRSRCRSIGTGDAGKIEHSNQSNVGTKTNDIQARSQIGRVPQWSYLIFRPQIARANLTRLRLIHPNVGRAKPSTASLAIVSGFYADIWVHVERPEFRGLANETHNKTTPSCSTR